jgi:hypothetical protein
MDPGGMHKLQGRENKAQGKPLDVTHNFEPGSWGAVFVPEGRSILHPFSRGAPSARLTLLRTGVTRDFGP